MTRIALVDNGSLRAASTRSLRAVAAALSARIGREVEAVSLLHSSAVPVDQLDGVPAQILEPWLKRHATNGEREFLVVPFFFGPSRALTGYVPERIAALKLTWPELRVRVASPLVAFDGSRVATSASEWSSGADDRLASILEERVRATLAALPDELSAKPAVAVVDHGSPEPKVTAVRDLVAKQLRARLGDAVAAVEPCSMERREGAEYAFADPLLTALLDRAPFDSGNVVVAMLFLSPGRHAGDDGDVARICQAAETRHPKLKATMTELLGSHPGIIEILAERIEHGLAAGGPAPRGA